MLKGGNFLSNSEHRLSETGNAKLPSLFFNKNSQETLFYVNGIAVSRGNAEADTPRDGGGRARLGNAPLDRSLT